RVLLAAALAYVAFDRELAGHAAALADLDHDRPEHREQRPPEHRRIADVVERRVAEMQRGHAAARVEHLEEVALDRVPQLRERRGVVAVERELLAGRAAR